MNLRKQAKGRDCQIRVPGYCSFNPEQTVGCHLRMAGITGISMKASDLLMAHGCYPCHQVIDGGLRTDFTPEERELMFFQGMARTLVILINEGKIKW